MPGPVLSAGDRHWDRQRQAHAVPGLVGLRKTDIKLRGLDPAWLRELGQVT